MIKSEPFQIGDDIFTVQPMLGEESFIFQPRLAPIVVELSSLLTLQVKEGEDHDIPDLVGKIVPVVERVAAKLRPEELRDIVRTLLRGATMNGKPLYGDDGTRLIDVLMQGRSFTIWKLLAKALEASYPDFFDRLRGLRVRAEAARASGTSGTSSPGSAGGSS